MNLIVYKLYNNEQIYVVSILIIKDKIRIHFLLNYPSNRSCNHSTTTTKSNVLNLTTSTATSRKLLPTLHRDHPPDFMVHTPGTMQVRCTYRRPLRANGKSGWLGEGARFVRRPLRLDKGLISVSPLVYTYILQSGKKWGRTVFPYVRSRRKCGKVAKLTRRCRPEGLEGRMGESKVRGID